MSSGIDFLPDLKSRVIRLAITMNSIHDRMPVVLPQDAESDWLAADPDTRKELCQPYPKDDLDAYEISTRVNNPGNDDPQVIEPLDREQPGLGEFGSG